MIFKTSGYCRCYTEWMLKTNTRYIDKLANMFELFEQYFTDDLNRVQKLPIREVKQYGLNMFEFFDIVLELEGLFPDYISIDGYTGVRGDLNSAKANNALIPEASSSAPL